MTGNAAVLVGAGVVAGWVGVDVGVLVAVAGWLPPAATEGAPDPARQATKAIRSSTAATGRTSSRRRDRLVLCAAPAAETVFAGVSGGFGASMTRTPS